MFLAVAIQSFVTNVSGHYPLLFIYLRLRNHLFNNSIINLNKNFTDTKFAF